MLSCEQKIDFPRTRELHGAEGRGRLLPCPMCPVTQESKMAVTFATRAPYSVWWRESNCSANYSGRRHLRRQCRCWGGLYIRQAIGKRRGTTYVDSEETHIREHDVCNPPRLAVRLCKAGLSSMSSEARRSSPYTTSMKRIYHCSGDHNPRTFCPSTSVIAQVAADDGGSC